MSQPPVCVCGCVCVCLGGSCGRKDDFYPHDAHRGPSAQRTAQSELALLLGDFTLLLLQFSEAKQAECFVFFFTNVGKRPFFGDALLS